MTKEEKIKEAYGEHWETVREDVDSDGWVSSKFPNVPIFDPWIGLLDEHEDKFAFRPKSISGIEIN